MSTLYATFRNTKAARAVVTELVRGGTRPEDVSLVAKQRPGGPVGGPISESSGSVGDASYQVGASDDPEFPTSDKAPLEEYSTLEGSPIGGIDTSDIGSDVGSVDEADESQELSGEMIYPRGGISQSEHQRDDVNLAIHTGFPTTIPMEDRLPDDQSTLSEENEDELETIVVPGFGYVVGGGALATQALDFSTESEEMGIRSLLSYFRDEGVPRTAAEGLATALLEGGSILSVVVTPGELDEDAIEALLNSRGAENVTLFDAPRFRNNRYAS